VWAYEKALQNECGYKGTQPYWDYGRWEADIYNAPLFDGSDTSVGGNGAPVDATAAVGSLNGGFNRGGMPGMAGRDLSGRLHPRQFGFGFGGGAGTGGGCVTTGPFKNMTISLGPMSPVVRPSPARNPQANGYGKNPRCLRRDMTDTLGKNFGKTSDIVGQITSFNNVLAFQNYMQGGRGVHGVGHFTVSGDPGGDFYTSPNEPSFWMHHAMIDRIWTIWQSLDYENRRMDMQGGTSMMGGSRRQQSLDDPTDLGVVGQNYAIRDIMSTVDGPGPFCYVYE
jgi:tyrosinase